MILQDLLMGEIDGLELVRRYRALPATAAVPVIMLSATAEGAVKRTSWNRRTTTS